MTTVLLPLILGMSLQGMPEEVRPLQAAQETTPASANCPPSEEARCDTDGTNEPDLEPDAGSQLPQRADYTLRLHHSGQLNKPNGEYRSKNLFRLAGGSSTPEIGYEILDDNQRAGIGVRVPLSAYLGARSGLSVFAEQIELSEEIRETEFRVAFQPREDLELILRNYELRAANGWSVTGHYRRDARFDAASNWGLGGIYATEIQRDFGTYAWTQIEKANRLFLGIGRFLRSDRYVIGMTKEDSGFAWRYFRLEPSNGPVLEEFLFSTQARHLKMRDAYATLIPIESNESFITGTGVFRYLVPAISARGRGLTGGLKRWQIPLTGRDNYEFEMVNYWYRDFFAGVSLRFDESDFSDGTIGLPIGWGFSGFDGLTRNYLRVEPTWDQASGNASVRVSVEVKRILRFQP